MRLSSLGRATLSRVPLSVAVVVAGDVTSLKMQIRAIKENNDQVWKTFWVTKDKNVLKQLQKIPTSSYSEKIQTVSAKSYDTIVT